MFKELAPYLRQRAVLLTVTHVEDDQIRVNVIPQKLKDGENAALTTPLTVTASAEELDRDLPATLVSFVGAHLGLKNSLDRAKAEMDAAAKAAQAEARSRGKTSATKAATKSEVTKPTEAPRPAPQTTPEPARAASLFARQRRRQFRTLIRTRKRRFLRRLEKRTRSRRRSTKQPNLIASPFRAASLGAWLASHCRARLLW
jgi:PRTRC genetic system protein E